MLSFGFAGYNSASVAANAEVLGYSFAGDAAFGVVGYGSPSFGSPSSAGLTGFNPGVPSISIASYGNASGLAMAASSGLIAPSVAAAIGQVRLTF